MKSILVLLLIAAYFITVSCKSSNKPSCRYSLYNLIRDDSSRVALIYADDTLTQFKDNIKDTPCTGIYNFDKNKILRFYAFYVNEKKYRYSETYDSTGNIVLKEGTPLVEYRIWKLPNDTILFNAFLFALNKKYADLEIVSNYNDTIRPKHLYKSEFYANMKSFAFKLPVASKINNLVLYASGTIRNTCTQERETFNDTVSFRDVKLH